MSELEMEINYESFGPSFRVNSAPGLRNPSGSTPEHRKLAKRNPDERLVIRRRATRLTERREKVGRNAACTPASGSSRAARV